jgi:hypothetical protein
MRSGTPARRGQGNGTLREPVSPPSRGPGREYLHADPMPLCLQPCTCAPGHFRDRSATVFFRRAVHPFLTAALQRRNCGAGTARRPRQLPASAGLGRGWTWIGPGKGVSARPALRLDGMQRQQCRQCPGVLLVADVLAGLLHPCIRRCGRVSANPSSGPLPAPGRPPPGNGAAPHSWAGSCPSSLLPVHTTGELLPCRRAFRGTWR